MPDIVIAFFALGLVAGLVKSDLKVPHSIYETLSILLMLSIGLKGGMALHGQGNQVSPLELLSIAALGVMLPLAMYPLLRYLIRLTTPDAVSIAAHYGSVSAGTFAVVLALAEQSHMALRPETTLYLVLLELPAIVVMLMLYRYLQGSTVTQSERPASIWLNALTSRGVVLLMGGTLIGWLYGHDGLEPLAPALFGGFKTLLALFLLEMGLCTAKMCYPLPLKAWRLLLFAALMPFVLAWCGIGTGLLLGLPAGSILVLAALVASASYIAAPAAIRAAVPDANLGIAMLAALGITFPVNVLIGLPLYQRWIMQLSG